MSRKCPIYGSTVLYLDCLECEEKRCRNNGRAESKDRNRSTRYATSQKDVTKNQMDEAPKE